MKFIAPSDFSIEYLANSACFDHLKHLTAIVEQTNFPSVALLNTWLAPTVKTMSALPVTFVEQPSADELTANWNYEAHIAGTGEVPTRCQNWHDLFGALMWCLFPKTKAVFNYWHHHDLLAEQTSAHQAVRSKRRHVITALDECGVIIVTKTPDTVEMLQQHRWVDAFWHQRSNWESDVRVFMIGHANYEMMTRPFLGLTGKAWHVPMPDAFFVLPLDEQYRQLDQMLASYLVKTAMLSVKSQLFPLPLLGIPMWHKANTQYSFYLNTDYFRPSRGRTVAAWDGV